MNEKLVNRLGRELDEIRQNGLFKNERIIESPQGAEIIVGGKTVINLCANNYLGLSSHPKVLEAAKKYIENRGYGMSSVRFICGTQDIHKELEQKISAFLGTEDTILYAAAFDANGGVFEPLFNEHDAIISDALNHASIIDGVRLCKFCFRDCPQISLYRSPSCNIVGLTPTADWQTSWPGGVNCRSRNPKIKNR